MWAKFSTLLAILGAVSLPLAEGRTAGCGKSPPSSGVKTLTSSGRQRQYTLTLPDGYNPNTEYKLIFGYHWLNGNMGNVAPGYYGLRALSQNTAIFVAPNGLNAGWSNSNGEDIVFTDAILAQVSDQLCVDEKNIFATGFSFGGAMSFSAACARPNVFKAIAVIAGAQLSGCAGGNTPVPYLGIHGSADNVLSIERGRSLRDKFLGLNGCQNRNVQDPGPGSSQVVRTDYTCRDGYPVTWIAYGGGHIGDPQFAPQETWRFFTQPGLKGDGGGTNPPPTTTTTSAGNQPTTGPCSAKYGQCGGTGWNGPRCCESGSTCRVSNEWYSQCL